MRPVLAVAVGIAVAMGAWGVRRHIEPWREAARLRDAVVGGARAALAGSGCRQGTFTNVPESIGGAYVLGNGFHESVGVPAPEAPSPACTFEWTGGAFRPAARDADASSTP
jgi:hypothetical protein